MTNPTLPDIMARLYGPHTDETYTALESVQDELRTVLNLLDSAAIVWGDQDKALYRDARDRLRKVAGE
jgi:hypothetical protein